MSEELKPCPFCGGKAAIKRNKTVLVDCTECTATVFQCADDPTWAIKTWNRRSDADFKAGMAVTRGDIAQLRHEHAVEIENVRAEAVLGMQAARRAALEEAIAYLMQLHARSEGQHNCYHFAANGLRDLAAQTGQEGNTMNGEKPCA